MKRLSFVWAFGMERLETTSTCDFYGGLSFGLGVKSSIQMFSAKLDTYHDRLFYWLGHEGFTAFTLSFFEMGRTSLNRIYGARALSSIRV